MESTMVIKVKYGDTLRRFNACIDENEKLDLDLSGLREKILGLFNFPPDADLTLTYVDEDGDIVTLVDDEDLCDVMRQRLKFLRINVQLNSDRNGKSSYARSSGSSTPSRPPRFQQPLPDLNNKVAEILKSVPESLHEALSKQSLDFASKSASSNPMLADLVESFFKMGLSQLSPVSQSQPGVQSNTQAEASESVIAPSVPRDPNASKDGGLQEVFPKPFVLGGSAKKGAWAPFVPISSPVDLNLPPNDSDPIGSTTVGLVPAVSHAPVDDDRKDAKEINGHPSDKCVGAIASTSSVNPTGSYNVDQPRTMGRNPSTECPFSGIPIPNDLAGNGHPRISSSKRNAAISMFHRGVQCDGCGVHPIIGPRFKSKVKEDYDLCNICFDAMGNETDYIRMDRPLHYRHPRPFKGFDHRLWLGTRTSPPILSRIKACRPKLDSSFVSDVNVLDGTLMAPSTPFTKIWRMRNSGNIPWPRGAKLWCIGGDKFSDAFSVEIEIPTDGLPVNGELDIAADFIAPELPGRYISYWRMASPSGVKFGQRVWVLIQVDASLKDSLQGLNLNLPPESNRSKGPEIIDANVQPIVDGGFQESRNPSYIIAEPVKPVVGEQPKKEQEQDMNFPINDSLLVGHDASASAPPPPTHWASSTYTQIHNYQPAEVVKLSSGENQSIILTQEVLVKGEAQEIEDKEEQEQEQENHEALIIAAEEYNYDQEDVTGLLSIEELNKKCDEFIRKMKEEIKLDPKFPTTDHENLLLTADHKTVKLADFGLVREESLTEMMTSETGTYRWMAPELYSTVTLRQGEKKHYNHKVDAYSFAIVLWELLHNKLPFEGMSNLQAAYAAAFKNVRPSVENLPEELATILKEDPNARPNFSQIIQMLPNYLSTISPPESPGTSSLMAVRDGSGETPKAKMENKLRSFFFCFNQRY